MYDEAVVQYFLEHQMQLFKENVAESPEEAEEFLEDCMAVVCKNIKEVRAYFEDEGRGSFCNPGRQISDRGSVGMTFLWNTLCQNTDACEKSVNRTNRQVRGKKNETI